MYTVRKIETEKDFAKTKQLWTVHAKLMRTKVPERTDFDIGDIYGAFTGDDLAATLRVCDFQSVGAYSLDSLYVKPGQNMYYASLTAKSNPIVPLIDEAIRVQEEKGLYTWYYSRAITPGYTKIDVQGHGFLSNSTRGNRYERYIMAIVKAGQKTDVKLYSTMLGDRVYARDIMLVMCCLKNEYREPELRLLGDNAKPFL